MDYWRELTRVSEYLIIALCKIMGIDEKYIFDCMKNPLTNMTLLNYPPTPPVLDTWGQHPHKDFHLLTLLAPSTSRVTSGPKWVLINAMG